MYTRKKAHKNIPYEFKERVKSLLLTHSIPMMEKELNTPNCRTMVNQCVDELIRDQKEKKEAAHAYMQSGRMHKYHQHLVEYFREETDRNRRIMIQIELDRLSQTLFQ